MIVAGGFLVGAILFAQVAQPIHRVFDPLQLGQLVSFKQLFSEREPLPAATSLAELSITTLEGEELSLKGLASQSQLVIINFWATWCAPCIKEMPYFEKIHRKYQSKGVSVLGIAAQDNTSEVKSFVNERNATYKIALDIQNEWAKAFDGTKVLPTTVFLDSGQNVLKIHKGYLTLSELEATVNKHLVE
jgi:thiol-disulfide isomerase/thioredoxin